MSNEIGMNSGTVAEQQSERSAITRGVLRWLLGSVVFILILAASLLVSSGRLDWLMAWGYVGVYVGSRIITLLILALSDPELLVERAENIRGPRDLDRVLAGVMALFGPVSMWIVAGLDERYVWSSAMPLALQLVGLGVVMVGSLVTIWAMASNTFFSGVVRIQEERGHAVVTGGPYRYVRHPGYVGGVLFYLATPLALGALWALIPAGLTACVTIIRTALEDVKLQEELDGYAEYAVRVRYRLLPGVW